MTFSVGQQLGAYRIVRPLGKGGMGEVYEAKMADGSRAAVKVFTNEGVHADFLRKRFIAEGKLLSRLDHPRLVKVHRTAFDAASGRPYFAMDLVLDADGSPRTLEDARRSRTVDEEKVAAVYSDLREGLAYLHGKGIAHRDVKLENVLIDADGHAVFSDFGVSRIYDEKLRKSIAVTTTMAGERAPIMGSFGYLAPELKRGEAATPASDAYALGVLLFRLLTGVWYEADSTARDLLAGLDPVWNDLLAQLLNEDPVRRLPMPEKVSLGTKRKRLTALRGLALLCAGVGIAAAFLLFLQARTPKYSFDEFFITEQVEQ